MISEFSVAPGHHVSLGVLDLAWFTEGFDTVDLKEAKALFDELGT